MGWLSRDCAGLHWREDGDPSGRPVLLLNSLGTDMRLWDGIVPHLSGRHRLIRMDTRGHGLSDAPDGPYNLGKLVEDAEALIDRLELKDLLVVGVSLGGMMAQMLAVRRPGDIRGLVLSNTGLRMGTTQMWSDRIAAVTQHGLESIAEAVLERWFSPDFLKRPELGQWRNMLVRTPARGYAGCCAALAQADLTTVAPDITCPSLVIAGGADGASPPEVVRAVADAVKGSAYEELPRAGHLPMIEEPARFAALVEEFSSGAQYG